MQSVKGSGLFNETIVLESASLHRDVQVDFYLPGRVEDPSSLRLLLINDGQDLPVMDFSKILGDLYGGKLLHPILCAGIHASRDRKMEYGVAAMTDYQGRGAKAAQYTGFVFSELIPYILNQYKITGFAEQAFAGFSLGALSALDIVWNHPDSFTVAGLFSGSFWWRMKDQKDPAYNDDTDRIMHRQVREGGYHPGLKFFFECGTKDELEDRNGNGIIDSIDDTQDLIKELVKKGYDPRKDIRYLEIPDGRHDVVTWGLAMPGFLQWFAGRNGHLAENTRPVA
ncbi:MAG: alpha/beta hydrolase-fold protein [Puia sp.]|nr:alpha/beta hydrolase-fold protein [Puia sp.]